MRDAGPAPVIAMRGRGGVAEAMVLVMMQAFAEGNLGFLVRRERIKADRLCVEITCLPDGDDTRRGSAILYLPNLGDSLEG